MKNLWNLRAKRNDRKPIKDLKDSIYSLVYNKKFNHKIDSCVWGSGPNDLGQKCLNLPHLCCHPQIQNLLNSFRAGWFRRFSQEKTAVFGCLTNALAPPPIVLESCSRAQTDRPVQQIALEKKFLLGGAGFLSDIISGGLLGLLGPLCLALGAKRQVVVFR